MLLSDVVIKLRAADTRFGNRIAGVAELNVILEESTLNTECAFVLHAGDSCKENEYDGGINQIVKERFEIIVALRNDLSMADKTGLAAIDSVHTVRAEIWKGVLGWIPDDAESLVSYAGSSLIRMNRAWLWYRFAFTVDIRITDDDGIDVGAGDLGLLDTIRAQFEITPSRNIPISESLPVTSFTPDMTTLVDLTEDLDAGGFSEGFAAGFELYTG